MFVDNFLAIDKNLSLGPKRSIARIFWKISCSHGDKRFWLTFFKNINCEKSPGTVCKCSNDFLTFTTEVIGSFLQHMRGCWKHNFLKKKAIFPVRKKIMARFFSFYHVRQTSKTGLQGSSRFFQCYCVGYNINSLGPTRLLKSWEQIFFWKKGNFLVKEKFWPTFSHFIEHNKDQETFFEVPQGLFDHFSAINKNLSLGPKMSRARIFFKN